MKEFLGTGSTRERERFRFQLELVDASSSEEVRTISLRLFLFFRKCHYPLSVPLPPFSFLQISPYALVVQKAMT